MPSRSSGPYLYLHLPKLIQAERTLCLAMSTRAHGALYQSRPPDMYIKAFILVMPECPTCSSTCTLPLGFGGSTTCTQDSQSTHPLYMLPPTPLVALQCFYHVDGQHDHGPDCTLISQDPCLERIILVVMLTPGRLRFSINFSST